MQPRTIARVSLTALLGTPVTDSQGHLRGRLKDIAVATGPDAPLAAHGFFFVANRASPRGAVRLSKAPS